VNGRALRDQAIEYLRRKSEQSPEMAALKAENEEMCARLAALEAARKSENEEKLVAAPAKPPVAKKKKAPHRKPVARGIAPINQTEPPVNA
jgi:hypothetical protein